MTDNNGIINSYDDFKKLNQDEQNFHIYSRLTKIQNSDDLDRRYALKWVEKVIIWAGTIGGGVILMALINLVIKSQ